MRFALIVNPGAGRVRGARLKAVLSALRGVGVEVEVLHTGRPGHAVEIARECAASREFDRLIAAGGDGTINEVAQGLRGSDIPLGLLPLGSANVLAREIGVSLDPVEAARDCVEGEIIEVHPAVVRCIGTAKDETKREKTEGAPFFMEGEWRRFLLMVGIGPDAAVVGGVSPRLKRWLGRGAFAAAAGRLLLRGWSGSCRVVSADETAAAGAGVIIANSAHYGGPWVLDSEADIRRRGLRVCVFPGRRRADLLRYAVGLITGRLSRAKHVRRSSTQRVEVHSSAGACPVQVDGEFAAASATIVEAGVDSEPLLLVVPRGRAGQ